MKVKADKRALEQPLAGGTGRDSGGRARSRSAGSSRRRSSSSAPGRPRPAANARDRHPAVELVDRPRARLPRHTTRGRGRSWSTRACTPRSSVEAGANMGRAHRLVLRPELEPGKDLPAQLRARGLDPKGDQHVVMTHLHVDHASGMSEFGGASVHPLRARVGGGDHGSRPFMHGYARRTTTTRSTTARSTSRARRRVVFDLRAHLRPVRRRQRPPRLHARSHRGHQSVICRLRDRDLVIAGDAIYTLAQLEDAPPPPRPEDPHTWRRSAGAAPVPPPVPAGGDRPRPRPQDVAGPGAVPEGAEPRRGRPCGPPLRALSTSPRPDRRPVARPRAAGPCGSAICGNVTGCPYCMVTFGNRRRFQRLDSERAVDRDGTTGTPDVEREPADAGPARQPAGARRPPSQYMPTQPPRRRTA